MKLVRFADATGMVHHGVLSEDTIAPISGDLFGPRVRAGAGISLKSVRLLSPIAPCNLLCLGKNYRAFPGEQNAKFPAEPLLFLKLTTAVIGPEDAIVLPSVAPSEVYFEAELAVVIGKSAHRVSAAAAMDHVLGFTICNDLGARDCQAKDGQWARAKSFDTFAPIGPWIETEFDPAHRRVASRLNGKPIQDASTDLMLFDVPFVISYFSSCMTLLPGTVISMGSPGVLQEPRPFLSPGDMVEVEVDGLGVLRNPVGSPAGG